MVGPVIFDTIKRYLVYLGYQVTWVVNITDVDDKLIDQARKDGTTVKDLAEQVTRDYLDCLAALGVDGIDQMPRATEHIGEIIAINQGLIDQGIRLRVWGRRLLRCDARRRVRQAQPPRSRRTPGRRPDRALVAQAKRGGFRTLEEFKARRALVGKPVGTRPARLAHRMLGHEHEIPRDALRYPRRRTRPCLPPPRERAGPVGMLHRSTVRLVLAAQRALDQGRQEDLQVRSRYRRPHERPAEDPRAGHACACSCFRAIIDGRSTTARTGSRRSSAACKPSTGRSSGMRNWSGSRSTRSRLP